MKRLFLGAVAVALLVGCGQDQSEPVETVDPPADAAPEASDVSDTSASPVDSVRLYTLDCGELDMDKTPFGSEGEYEGERATAVVTCFLIRHPDGDMVWDAGLPDAINQLPDGQEIPLGRMTVPVTLESQLVDLGVPPEDVEYFAFSHSHFDHVGNANLFVDSKILTQPAEIDFMYGLGAETGVVLPELVEPIRESEFVTYEGDYDVFGDGSVTIVPATGHTPGHSVLRLDLPNEGIIWLSGDLYHFVQSREQQIVPAFNFSKPDTLAAMQVIEDRIEADNGRLVIQHVPEHRAQLPDLPGYLD